MAKGILKSFIIFSLLICFACKNKDVVDTSSFLNQNMPSSFLSFFEQFHSDSTFQKESIIFPFNGLEQNGETMMMDTIIYNIDNWILHKPFNNHGGTFEREFINFNGIIIEKISDVSKTYQMERRFAIIDSKWHLIYYSTFRINMTK